MNVFGVVYPYCRVNVYVEASFLLHLEVIVSFYCALKTIGDLLMFVLHDKLKFESQAFILKQPCFTMRHKFKGMMTKNIIICRTCDY